jgi:hypothetical protein
MKKTILRFIKTTSGVNRLAIVIALGVAFYYFCSGVLSSLKSNYYLSPYLSTGDMIEGFLCDALLFPILALVFSFIVIRTAFAVGKYGLRICLNLFKWAYKGFKYPTVNANLRSNRSTKRQ